MNAKIYGSSFFAAILLLCLIGIAFHVSDNSVAKALNVSVIVFGCSFGWVGGIVISPYTADEQSTFTRLSKEVAVFGSGYMLGKVDKLVGSLFDPALVLTSEHGFRILAAFSAFAISMVITFVFRQYMIAKYL